MRKKNQLIHKEQKRKELRQSSYNTGYKNGYMDAVSSDTKTAPDPRWIRAAYENGYMDGYQRGMQEAHIR